MTNLLTGYWTMLATDHGGRMFSQWTEGENEHLGKRVLLSAIGARALDTFFSRLSIPDDIIGEDDEG